MFKDMNLHPVYDSANCDLVRDLQVPLLSLSIEYLRGVGYFTSGWLRIAAVGIAQLAENGGKARMIVSPQLTESDWLAIQAGDSAVQEEIVLQSLITSVSSLASALEHNTLNALTWLVADGVLEFRFAIPRQRGSAGQYHDKVGVLTDKNGDVVAIHGSLNDTYQGNLNGEAFSVFKSWIPGQRDYVESHKRRLEKLWEGTNEQFRTCKIPDVVREELIRLRIAERPYFFPDDVPEYSVPEPKCPVKLHSYQQQAIDAWLAKDCVGILDMATGTGKTYTALAAAVEVLKMKSQLALVILVPYLHLLEQWKRNCEAFGFTPIICSGQHRQWKHEVLSELRNLQIGAISNICIVAVHNTAATDELQKRLTSVETSALLVIGDEAHKLGAKKMRKALTETAKFRLGLSATPRRWFDEKGTEALFQYFDGVCFEYGLEEAIGNVLTPYNFYPVPVALNEDELISYVGLSQEIAKLLNKEKCTADEKEQLKMLMLKRAKVIACAESKLPALLDHLRLLISRKGLENVRDVLIYCAPGTHRAVLRAVADTGLRCHEFVHDVSLGEREKLLTQFARGQIQALVAIKCLDEGVDVPSTQTAFILASSSNPREFVQRRGRILRQSPGKNEAQVYDFIVLPQDLTGVHVNDYELSILKREMPRFAEFSSTATNQYRARAVLRPMLERLELLDLLDIKPWDVYHMLKAQDWDVFDD